MTIPTNGVEPSRPATASRSGRGPALHLLSLVELLAATDERPADFLAFGIPKVGVTVQAGPPKVGKSLLAGQLALAVASGLPECLGQRVGTGGVVYVIEEGSQQGLAWRVRRQMAGLGLDRAAVRFAYRQRVRLDERASVAALRGLVTAMRPALIVMDPLNRLHGRDENRPSDMTPVMDAAAAIAYDLACAVLIVHHVAKPSQERGGGRTADLIRGAGAIRAASDANLVLRPRGSDTSGLVHVVGEFRDSDPLDVTLELDRESLLFRLADEPHASRAISEEELVSFVEEAGRVTAAQVAARFGVRSKKTAQARLEEVEVIDWTEGARNTRHYFLRTA